MVPIPFRVEKDHVEVFKATGRFTILSNQFYTLPSVNAYDLPQTERTCRVCKKPFLQQRGQDEPHEVPIVLKCGHIVGSKCLDIWCNLRSAPHCFVCLSAMTFAGGLGVHSAPSRVAPGAQAIEQASVTSIAPAVNQSSGAAHLPITPGDALNNALITDNAPNADDSSISGYYFMRGRPHPSTGHSGTPSTSTSIAKSLIIPDAVSLTQPILFDGYSADDMEAALALLGIGPEGISVSGFSAEDVRAALTLLGISKVSTEKKADAQDPMTGLAAFDKGTSLAQPSNQLMQAALERFNEANGVALSLDELEVVLALCDSRNGTKTLVSEALKEWL